MKTKLVTIAALLVAACEGEPPKTPAGVAAGPIAPATEQAQAADEGTADTNGAAPATPAPCACQCGCGGGGAAAAVASDAGAPATDGGAALAATPAPAPPPTTGTVLGHVTTTPASAASHSVVFVEDGPADEPSKRAAVIDNHNMTFSPFVQVVPTGNRVVFQNSDPFPHNVFSPDNGGFNIGVIPQRSSASRMFKAAGEYSLLCNLHPGMLGYLVVTPNGHFAKADATGHYAIKGLPLGTYHVTAWAPRQKPITQSIEVKGGDAPLDFELHR